MKKCRRKKWRIAEKDAASKVQSREAADQCRRSDGAVATWVWAEVKTLVIGDVQPAVLEKGEMVVHTRNLSYFSRKVSSEEFERLSLGEMHRRGVENAKEVVAVMDGAEWEQSYIDYHCPQAVRILDFAHAADHINQVGEFLYGEHTNESKVWLKEHLHQLKHEGPKKIVVGAAEIAEKTSTSTSQSRATWHI